MSGQKIIVSSFGGAKSEFVGDRAVEKAVDSVLDKDARIAALESQLAEARNDNVEIITVYETKLAAAVRRAEEAERAERKLWGVWDNECGHWYGEMASHPRAAFAYDMDIDELKARWGKMGPEYIIAPFPRTQREWKEGPTAAIERARGSKDKTGETGNG